MLTGKPKEVVEHVQNERARRGWRSVREAADHTKLISNETWSKFERDGRVTPKVRAGIREAFDWPENWAEELPALTPWTASDAVEQIQRRLAEVEAQLEALQKRPPSPEADQ